MEYFINIEELKSDIILLKKLLETKEKELQAYYDKISSSKGFDNILYKNLYNGLNPSRAIEKSVEEYNSSRDEQDWISIRTAWRKYSLLKKEIKLGEKMISKVQFLNEHTTLHALKHAQTGEDLCLLLCEWN